MSPRRTIENVPCSIHSVRVLSLRTQAMSFCCASECQNRSFNAWMRRLALLDGSEQWLLHDLRFTEYANDKRITCKIHANSTIRMQENSKFANITRQWKNKLSQKAIDQTEKPCLSWVHTFRILAINHFLVFSNLSRQRFTRRSIRTSPTRMITKYASISTGISLYIQYNQAAVAVCVLRSPLRALLITRLARLPPTAASTLYIVLWLNIAMFVLHTAVEWRVFAWYQTYVRLSSAVYALSELQCRSSWKYFKFVIFSCSFELEIEVSEQRASRSSHCVSHIKAREDNAWQEID